MFIFAFGFIAHGTKQVQVQTKIPIFLKKKKTNKENNQSQIKTFSVINNQFLHATC